MVVWQAWGIDEPIGPQNPYPDTPPSLRGTVHPRRGRADRVQQEHVAKLLVSAGHACAAYQDRALRTLPCKRVQMDEIWSFVYAKKSQGRSGDRWRPLDLDRALRRYQADRQLVARRSRSGCRFGVHS